MRRPPNLSRDDRISRYVSTLVFAVELAGLLGQFAHDLDQIRLALEADARNVRHDDVTVLNPDRIRESPVGLEEIRVALVAAKPQAGGDVQRHLVTAVRDA